MPRTGCSPGDPWPERGPRRVLVRPSRSPARAGRVPRAESLLRSPVRFCSMHDPAFPALHIRPQAGLDQRSQRSVPDRRHLSRVLPVQPRCARPQQRALGSCQLPGPDPLGRAADRVAAPARRDRRRRVLERLHRRRRRGADGVLYRQSRARLGRHRRSGPQRPNLADLDAEPGPGDRRAGGPGGRRGPRPVPLQHPAAIGTPCRVPGRRCGHPMLLLYGCDDLEHWTELGPLLTDEDPIAGELAAANIWECPNLVQPGRPVGVDHVALALAGPGPRAGRGALFSRRPGRLGHRVAVQGDRRRSAGRRSGVLRARR